MCIRDSASTALCKQFVPEMLQVIYTDTISFCYTLSLRSSVQLNDKHLSVALLLSPSVPLFSFKINFSTFVFRINGERDSEMHLESQYYIFNCSI